MKRVATALVGGSLVFALQTLAIGGASAQQIASSRFYKVVDRGQRVQITGYYSIDPACHSLGHENVNLLREPQGGTVEIRPGTSFPFFPPNNPRSACNRRKVPSLLLFYRAGPSFTGTDSFDVETVFPDGLARKYRYIVTVR